MSKRLQYALVLGVISIITAVGIGTTYVTTKEKIRQREEARRLEALLAVLPGTEGNPAELTPPEVAAEDKVYKGLARDQSLVGYAALGEAQGYSSRLKVMVGLTPSLEKVTGIRILFQQETPGLGTKVIEVATTKTLWNMFFGPKEAVSEEASLSPWFQEQFKGRGLNQLVVVREKDPEKITAITGATITTKAVVSAVENAVSKIKKAVPGR